MSTDVELPSRLSKLLNSHEDALDIVSLHVKMSELLPYALAFLADYDCETVGTHLFLKIDRHNFNNDLHKVTHKLLSFTWVT